MKKLLIALLALGSVSAFAMPRPMVIDAHFSQKGKLVVALEYTKAVVSLALIDVSYNHIWKKDVVCLENESGKTVASIEVSADLKVLQYESKKQAVKKLKFNLNTICDGKEVDVVVLNGTQVL
jgi:hypothetical protein